MQTGRLTVERIKHLKKQQSARAKSPFNITHGLAQVALLNSGVVIGTVKNSVVSINQQGGITAHTVNQAPAPELRILSQSAITEGEWSKTTAAIEVVAPYPVANLYIEAASDGIEEFDVVPTRSGAFTFGPTGKRTGFFFTNVQQAYGRYNLIVRSRSKAVQIRHRFG